MEKEEIKKIFDDIYKNNISNIKNFINKNILIDYNNIINDNNINLINYCIYLNRIEILKEFLKIKNLRLDTIYNENEHSILYTPIKLNYIDIIKLLLEYDNKHIGISILNVEDNKKLIPLHYCIIYNNKEVFDMIVKKSNLYKLDEENNNFCLYSIKYNRYELFKYFMELNIYNINFTNKNNQTIFHLAASKNYINFIEYIIKKDEYNFYDFNIQDTIISGTPLNYLCYYNHLNIIKKIFDKYDNININDIDNEGNNLIHYCIENNYLDILDYFLNKSNIFKSINFNIYNIHLNYPLHIIFKNISKINLFLSKIEVFNTLIQYTNLNFKNQDGYTCLYYLCKYDIWDKFIDILKYKKLDFTKINNKNEYMINYIKEDKKEKFKELLINSYINLNNDKDIDKNKLKKDIEKNINLYNDDDYHLDYIRDFYQINDIVSLFSGLSIDIISGLIYIKNKYKELDIIIPDDKIRYNICDNYNQYKIELKNEFECLIEYSFIIWYYPNLIYNDYIIEQIQKKIKEKKKYIIIFLILIDNENRHANILLINTEKKEVERYDPYGIVLKSLFNFNVLDDKLNNFIKFINNEYKYISNNINSVSLQYLETKDPKKIIGDPEGFCISWCIFYIDLRLKYQEIKKEKIINYIIEYINDNNMSYKYLIRNYSNNIVQIRNKILDKCKINFNNYYNYENIFEKDFLNILKTIQTLI